MKAWILAAVAACSPHATGPGTETGSGKLPPPPPPVAAAKTCDDVKPRVEQMYRDEAQVKEPKRVDDATADNTAMVMRDCTKDPGKTVPCLAKAGSVAELEKKCLIPLDDEGTEGEALAR